MSHRTPLRTFLVRARRQRHARATLSHTPAAALCSGAKGIHSGSRRPFTYKGTKFHRVVKSFMAQVPPPSSAAAPSRPAVAPRTLCIPCIAYHPQSFTRAVILYLRTAAAARLDALSRADVPSALFEACDEPCLQSIWGGTFKDEKAGLLQKFTERGVVSGARRRFTSRA